MEIADYVKGLYDNNTKTAYQNLQILEALSTQEDVLYPYFEEFLAMLHSEQYTIRVRGFRLACKQAQWDTANKLDAAADDLCNALHDEKPTAVRQALKALEDVAAYKPTLRAQILYTLDAIDLTQYKDSMRPLIQADMQRLKQLLYAQI